MAKPDISARSRRKFKITTDSIAVLGQVKYIFNAIILTVKRLAVHYPFRKRYKHAWTTAKNCFRL